MRYHTLIFLAIGIGFLALLVLFIGPVKIEEAIAMANPLYVLLALAIQFILYLLWTVRWSINIHAVGISIKKMPLLPMTLVGKGINNITPAGGGEPVRAYILSKFSQSPTETSFASVIADRGLDTFPLFLLAIITIISAVLYLKLSFFLILTLTISLVILVVLFIIGFYMSINQKMGEKVTKWIVTIIKRFSKKEHSKLEKNALDALHGFQNSIRSVIKSRNVLLYALPLSFLIWFIEIIRLYIIFLAFNTHVSLLVIASVFVISALIALIPLLPGGVGAVDGVMIIIFSISGVPPSISAAATIIERLISFWLTSFIGVALIPYYGSAVLDKLSGKI